MCVYVSAERLFASYRSRFMAQGRLRNEIGKTNYHMQVCQWKRCFQSEKYIFIATNTR